MGSYEISLLTSDLFLLPVLRYRNFIAILTKITFLIYCIDVKTNHDYLEILEFQLYIDGYYDHE